MSARMPGPARTWPSCCRSSPGMIHTIPVRPMCRDYAAGIDAPIAGTVIEVPWRWLEEEAPCAPETRAGLNAALAVFRDLGATIRGVEPPPMQLFNDAKKIIAIAELYSIHEKDLKTRPELCRRQP